MVIEKTYDEQTKTEKAWYDSSMFIYTRAVEHDNENAVDLYVTFNNGSTYKYKDVKMEDYVLLISGFEQSSHGKTLNRIIKPNYEFEKCDSLDITDIWAECDKVKAEKQKALLDITHTYFISGHLDITDEEFEYRYQEAIINVVETDPDCKFIVGDADGVDIKSQNFLVDALQFNPDNITVYHMLDTPRNINEKITNTKGGFKTDEERDSEMTRKSSFDIAFVRDNKQMSGTAKNILRRFLL